MQDNAIHLYYKQASGHLVPIAGIRRNGACAKRRFILRRRMPDVLRPYKVPLVPLLFTAFSAMLVLRTIWDMPVLTGMGLLLIAIGVPFYLMWNKKGRGEGLLPFYRGWGGVVFSWRCAFLLFVE